MFRKKKKGKIDKVQPLLTDDQVRHAVLAILLKKAKEDINNWNVSREKLLEILEIPEAQLSFNVEYLKQEGLVKCREVANSPFLLAKITSKGINAIEHKKENKNRFPFLTEKIPIHIEVKIGIITF